jgi:hypothetical protein
LGQAVVALRDRLLRLVADRRGIVVPSLVADKREASEAPAEELHPEDETAVLSGALDVEHIAAAAELKELVAAESAPSGASR